MNTKAVGLVVVLAAALLGGGAYLVLGDNLSLGTSPTGNIVKNTYDLATGGDLEVLKVEEDGVLDRVVLRNGDNVITTYITQDGKYLVNNPVDVDEYTNNLEARESFISCLDESEATVYMILGSDNEQLQQHVRMAQLQVQVLGGTTGLQNILQGPGTSSFPTQRVISNGIVWSFDGELTNGIQTVPQLEDATGCEYDGPTA